MRKAGGTGRTENINEVAIGTLSKNGTDLGDLNHGGSQNGWKF